MKMWRYRAVLLVAIMVAFFAGLSAYTTWDGTSNIASGQVRELASATVTIPSGTSRLIEGTLYIRTTDSQHYMLDIQGTLTVANGGKVASEESYPNYDMILKCSSGGFIRIDDSGSVEMSDGDASFDVYGTTSVNSGGMIKSSFIDVFSGGVVDVNDGGLIFSDDIPITIQANGLINVYNGKIHLVSPDNMSLNITGSLNLHRTNKTDYALQLYRAYCNINDGGVLEFMDGSDCKIVTSANSSFDWTRNRGVFHLKSNGVVEATNSNFNTYDTSGITKLEGTGSIPDEFFEPVDANGIIEVSNGFSLTSTSFSNNQHAGTINIKQGGTFHTEWLPGKTPAEFDNSGTINVQGGTLTLNENLDNRQTINVSSGVVNINSGHTLNNGGTGASGGTLNIYDGTITIDGILFNGGSPYASTLNMSGGTIDVNGQLNSNGPSVSERAAFNLTGGNINVNSGSNLNNKVSDMSITGGVLKVSGNVNNGFDPTGPGTINFTAGMLHMDGGTITNGDADGTGNLYMNMYHLYLDGGYITNYAGNHDVELFGTDFTGITNMVDDGIIQVPAPFTITIPQTTTFALNSGGINNLGQIDINGALIIKQGAQYYGAGDTNNYGAYINYHIRLSEVVPGFTYTLPYYLTINIPEWQLFNVGGGLINLSPSTINIFGSTYTYTYFKNGESGSPGAVNVYHPGNFYLLSGEYVDGDSASTLSVHSGGNFYSYYGEVNNTLGGSDSIDIKAGGKFGNVRGNRPDTFTVNTGCNFWDKKEIWLDDDLELHFTWTFTEKAILHGNGKNIRFEGDGEIAVVGPDASLLLSDVILDNVSGNCVRCTDDTATLSMDNVVWIQDGDYTCTKGTVYIQGDWMVYGGGNSVSYESDQVCTVAGNASLQFFDGGLTYGQAGNSGLVQFADSSAYILLNRSSITADENCVLTNGRMFVVGESALIGNAHLDTSGMESIEVAGSLRRVGSVTL